MENFSRDLKMVYVNSSPKPTPHLYNHLASSRRLGTYPVGPGSAGSSSVPVLILSRIPLVFLIYSFN